MHDLPPTVRQLGGGYYVVSAPPTERIPPEIYSAIERHRAELEQQARTAKRAYGTVVDSGYGKVPHRTGGR